MALPHFLTGVFDHGPFRCDKTTEDELERSHSMPGDLEAFAQTDSLTLSGSDRPIVRLRTYEVYGELHRVGRH
ncbi:hypothetical protein AM571_PC02162 (plasmid) [Rhizobium etli 8C-3]|uniref:Uncharacterized protein n=2 Tax=Rhizobium TaxID=379 RepID=A0A4R3R6B2_9HYPH|nr:hypothetical protein AM571_PC02162 [Rhizobium etli 8C-3]TCU30683.1 hypothetical protein EV130_101254 [Rhizobium azibense]TCU41306.1 hypothetical protein EV129_101597 [Rhizobium azibense]